MTAYRIQVVARRGRQKLVWTPAVRGAGRAGLARAGRGVACVRVLSALSRDRCAADARSRHPAQKSPRIYKINPPRDTRHQVDALALVATRAAVAADSVGARTRRLASRKGQRELLNRPTKVERRARLFHELN